MHMERSNLSNDLGLKKSSNNGNLAVKDKPQCRQSETGLLQFYKLQKLSYHVGR